MIFTHSLVSDWNHGNAHFLRGIALEILARGSELRIFEPEDGWSRANLLADAGEDAIKAFEQHFPTLKSELYNEHSLKLDEALRDADIVIVHEWNTPELVAAVGQHRSTRDYQLFFHDTHHRMVTDTAGIAQFDLKHYDGVLAYGNVIRDTYRGRPGVRGAFTWHEAADIRTFHPMESLKREGDVVWIGNWGDDERAHSLREFLIQPIKELGLKARVYGVRYPPEALAELADADIEYGGWLPNYKVPEIFSQFHVTVHVPRGPYVTALPGIPTIRPFEALACGIPLISSPWNDEEHLFEAGRDFLFASNGQEMTRKLEQVLSDQQLSEALWEHGLNTIKARHTCGHRVDELIALAEATHAVEVAGGGA